MFIQYLSSRYQTRIKYGVYRKMLIDQTRLETVLRNVVLGKPKCQLTVVLVFLICMKSLSYYFIYKFRMDLARLQVS